jgi:hypothetical protein
MIERTSLRFAAHLLVRQKTFNLQTVVKNMKAEFTAIVKKDGDWWLGWVEEIPGANAQERTKEELLVSLKEAVIDIL